MTFTPELIAIMSLGFTVVASVVGWAYALGNMPKRSELNELRKEVNDLRKEVNESRREFQESQRELKAELIAEMRRSHQQLMRALITHRHQEPGGEPVFSEPPDTELVAADN